MFKKFIICFFISIFILYPCLSFADDITSNSDLISSNTTLVTECLSNLKTSDSPPTINSRSAVVIDRNSNTVLFGKNENSQVKMASTTKIMTALIVIENCDLTEDVVISKKAASTGGSRLGLRENDKVSVQDLLYGLILISGNDAAVALAEYVGGSIDEFANLMNAKANEIGLSNTNFKTPHGLDKDGHYTTAYELAILTNYALNNETFCNLVGTMTANISINGKYRTISNTNELLGNLDGVYGVKTGFTNGANRCLVSACRRQNLDIICVVLGADTKKFRTNDSISLIEYCFANFTPIDVSEFAANEFNKWYMDNKENFYIYKSQNPSNINLKLSDNSNLPFVFSNENKVIPIKNSEIDNLNFNINFNNNLIAPIKMGSVLGNVNIKSNDNLVYSVDVVCANDILKKGFFSYFVDILKKFH